MTAAATTETYASAHHIYRRLGWTGPLPLPDGKKWPPPEGWTGYHGGYPSVADSTAWTDDCDYGDTRQLALRLTDGIIGIDVDHYGAKRGADTITEAEHRWGPLPDAPYSSARGDGPSGIRYYRVPVGTMLRTVLRFPADETRGLPALADVEIIQHFHRYAVAWPSVHPDTGNPYLWHNTAGPDSPPLAERLPDLPQAWLDGLRAEGKTAGEVEADPETVARFARDHSTAANPAGVRGVVKVFERDAAAGSRHDAIVAATCMAAREARAGVYSAAEAAQALREAFVRALAEAKPGQRLVTPAEARREFAGAWGWAVGQAVALTPAEAGERVGAHRPGGAVQPGPPRGCLLKRGGASPLDPGAAAHVHAPVAAPAEQHDELDDEDDEQHDDEHAEQDGGQDEGGPGLHPDSGWAAVDLGPYLAGTVTRPDPDIGIVRRDGIRLFYAAKEHALIGLTESGKSWVALASVAAELLAGNHVLYIHFEEDDPSDTVERLILLGVPANYLGPDRFRFVAPGYGITPDIADHYVDWDPSLVILDGQNEGMALHGHSINDPEGAAAYRRLLVKPFTAAGAAVVSCDHVTKDNDKAAQGFAMGSVHKTNGITGTVVQLENAEPFGIGRRGSSKVFVTKDRPGKLRRHGQPSDVPRKFYLGNITVDATAEDGTVDLAWWAPNVEDDTPVATARDWNAPMQAEVPDDIAAYRGAGQKAILDLARFVRAMGQGGIGVDLSGARAALCRVKVHGRAKHDPETVGRAWGALYDMGRLAAADANTTANVKGLHWWTPRPGDPEHG